MECGVDGNCIVCLLCIGSGCGKCVKECNCKVVIFLMCVCSVVRVF